MFTGLIEATGTVVEMSTRGSARRIAVASALLSEGADEGQSVAVDGVCLTVVGRASDRFLADVVPETLARTTLGRLRQGSRVNLERALRLGDRLGGHLVQGHVDAVASVLRVVRRGEDYRLRVALDPAVAGLVAAKGSVALNGVSLTVASVAAGSFEVALIPETRARTNLGGVRAGDQLNLEADLLARYLESLMAARSRGPGSR